MTSNDAQMDVLLRRYAGKLPGSSTTEHLDADELSAFAEGSVPAAARSRYVSHLADCDNCRQIVSSLAISSGSVVAAEAIPAVAGSGYSWWKRLAGFLSPMTLRYAAFAMVLITAAGVVFLVTRRPRTPDLVARNEASKQTADAPAPSAAAPVPYNDRPASTSDTSRSETTDNKNAENQPASSQASPIARPIDQMAKVGEPRQEDVGVSPPAPKPAKEGDAVSFGQLARKKAEPVVTGDAPAYSPPPPPVAIKQSQIREQQSQTTVQSAGARKSGPADQFKIDKSERSGEYSKDGVYDNRVATNRAPAAKRAGDDKLKGPQRNMETNSSIANNSDELRGRNVQGILTQRADTSVTEEKPETRSAGGRKFRRQGNGWVDTKFKSSMPLKSIARGSNEFNELDSGLRSIAQQLGGQVLVVWKNKAYLIK